MLLEAGEICPAVCRLLTAFDLSCDESSLTGESPAGSQAVRRAGASICQGQKRPGKRKGAALDARSNIVFMGMPC